MLIRSQPLTVLAVAGRNKVEPDAGREKMTGTACIFKVIPDIVHFEVQLLEKGETIIQRSRHDRWGAQVKKTNV